jgi:hypothetical protein
VTRLHPHLNTIVSTAVPWFAVWRCLEEPEDAPPEQQWSVVRITPDDDGPGGLSFQEL